MRLLLRAVTLMTACGLWACGSPVQDCADVFIPAVTVTVVNPQGSTLLDARVYYSVDGGPVNPAVCNDTLVIGCETWLTPDQPGDYLVRATSKDGARSVEQRVMVEADGCHARGQSLRLTLPD